MAPSQTALVNLSPAELSFLRATLAQTPPIRLDHTKGPRDFRSMRAEYDVLPGANGSARIALEDGTEALVGVKAEVDRSPWRPVPTERETMLSVATGDMAMEDRDDADDDSKGKGQNSWVEVSVEIPGFREDDALPVFLASMLTESLLASGELKDRLYMNRRFHWKLYIDILLLSPPLSYPLALLSMTTHLALLTSRLPALKSERDENPLFDDDWDAAVALYPKTSGKRSISNQEDKPPVIVLAMAVGPNIIFDPCKEELAVADAVLAVACTSAPSSATGARIVSIRTIDPPSHLTPPGVPNSMNSATGGTVPASSADALTQRELLADSGVWTPPRGGFKRGMISQVVKMVVENGGIAEEVIGALQAIEVG
ncbi:3' exoribonuclease family, domain 1-domain-containing protein [Massariosphaeria phaeospora]|uniref:Ribosomal RNA-processing protein 42 n=1 Tax=Massariosphaeria phaeospora TaxID=100035 RepID=A0A7C8M6D0_9PLEO|nr:3' exoribonuclease family, domain 1-domain-containing protein [Massariosphaeria phaeospora]